MTKQQQIDVLKTENEQLRTQLAQTIGDNQAYLAEMSRQHAAELAMLNRKLYQLNSERAKWEHRARAAQSTSVSAPRASAFAAAREEAMRTGRTVRVGGVA